MSRTHTEAGLELSCRQLSLAEQGPIVEIRVVGGVSRRHSDHQQAKVLDEFVKECLAGLAPAGLLFDMENFKYRHGNSIFPAFVQAKPDRSGLIPVCIVAKGRSKRGLTSLLDLGGGSTIRHLVTHLRAEALNFLQDEAVRDSR